MPNSLPEAGSPLAWLVPNCPNFYFLPSMHYDRIFTMWASPFCTTDGPAYWQGRGLPVFPLYACEEAEATHWLANGPTGISGLFDRESADAARANGKTVTPLKPLSS